MTEREHKRIFEGWIGQYRALLFRIVRVYADTNMDREDLFQEISIQVWHSIPSFRQESSVTTWLYRIALNTAIKWIKKERSHAVSQETLDKAVHLLPENKILRDDRLDWLYEEISRLDEVDRSITLLLLEDFSYKEMSVILGISESNIGVKINRIKKVLITKSKKYAFHGI